MPAPTENELIEKIQRAAVDLAGKIGVPAYRAVPPLEPTENGSPHIEIHGNKCAYVITERGSEIERRETADLDRLLYWIFDALTFDMAASYELSHRISGEDSRRIMFSHQLMLLEKLSPSWAQRKGDEINALLLKFPFVDQPDSM